MGYLIATLAWPLLLLTAIGAFGGWCLHCVRRSPRVLELERERDRVRAELIGLAAPQSVTVVDDDARERVVALEREVTARDIEIADLRARIAHLDDAMADGERGRLLDAENERLRGDLDQMRLRMAEVEARPATISAPADDERSASKWRLRYLESRVKYLEGRLLEAESAEPKIDPARFMALENDLVAARTAAQEAEQLRVRITALEPAAAEAAALRAALDDERNRGKWQTRYLEARVKHLEGLLAAAPPPPDPSEAAREKWRARYHEERVKFLESQERQAILAVDAVRDQEIATLKETEASLARDLAAAKKEAADADFLREMIATLEADLKAARAEAAALDEARRRVAALEAELAQLKALPQVDESELTRARWKGRYLESRVRYLEDRMMSQPARPALPPLVEPQPLYTSPAGRGLAPPPPVAPPPPPPTQLRERLVWRQVRIVEEAPVEIEPPPPPPPPPPPAPPPPRYVWRQVRVIDEEETPAPAPLPPPPPPPPPAAMRERTVWARILVTEDEQDSDKGYTYPDRDDPPYPGRAYRPLAAVTPERRPPGLSSPRGGAPDDLRMIGGVGPKIEGTLHDLGIFHFDQIARWTDAEVAWVDQYLAFRGRIGRERWVEQAQALARGEDTEAKRRYLEGDHV